MKNQLEENMEKKLTEQDLIDLQYFWGEKGDLERLSTFESLRPLLAKERPDILLAWDNYKMAIKMMDIVMEEPTEKEYT